LKSLLRARSTENINFSVTNVCTFEYGKRC